MKRRMIAVCALIAALCLLLAACGQKPAEQTKTAQTPQQNTQNQIAPGHTLPETEPPSQSGFMEGDLTLGGVTVDFDNVKSVTLRIDPPGTSVELGQRECGKFLEMLHNVRLQQRDDSYTDYDGRNVEYTVELQSGEKHTFNFCGSFVIVDGVGYQSDSSACADLVDFGSELIPGE